MNNMKRWMSALALASLLAFHVPAVAQQRAWNDAQAEVWGVVSQSWKDDVAANGKWPEDYLHPLALAWDVDWPTPQNADSITRWTRAREAVYKTLVYELFPMGISVAGDTAAVHYSVVRVSQMMDNEPRRSVGYVTETLVRDGGEWKFLSLSSWDAPEDD